MKRIVKLTLFLGVALFASSLFQNQIQGVQAWSSGDALSTNSLIKNTWLEYSSAATAITNWKIYGTTNINGGIGNEKTISTSASGGKRDISGFSQGIAQVKTSSSGKDSFTTYLSKKDYNNNGFLALTQTVSVQPDLVYTIASTIKGTTGTLFKVIAYNDTGVAGVGPLVEGPITLDDINTKWMTESIS